MKLHNQSAISLSVHTFQRNASSIEKSLSKLSTGMQISKASDSASGLAISESMKAQIRGIAQAQRNMQDGLSVLEASNEGLNNVNGLLQRIRELSVMSANGTLTGIDRQAGTEEMKHLLGAINDTAEKLEFNTKKILGENAPLHLMVGANPGQKITIDMVDTSTAALGLESLSLDSASEAERAIGLVDAAIKQVTGNLTKVGSHMESLEHHLLNATLFEGNLSMSLSQIKDTDMAEEMMTFLSSDIRQKGDLLLVSQVNKNIESIMGLFRK